MNRCTDAPPPGNVQINGPQITINSMICVICFLCVNHWTLRVPGVPPSHWHAVYLLKREGVSFCTSTFCLCNFEESLQPLSVTQTPWRTVLLSTRWRSSTVKGGEEGGGGHIFPRERSTPPPPPSPSSRAGVEKEKRATRSPLHPPAFHPPHVCSRVDGAGSDCSTRFSDHLV